MTVTYSLGIERLCTLLRESGVTVTFSAPLPPDVLGRYDARTKTILLADEPSAKVALMTLAHEAGHWFGYLLQPLPITEEGETSAVREREAQTYGWHLLGLVGMHALLTRGAWNDFHE